MSEFKKGDRVQVDTLEGWEMLGPLGTICRDFDPNSTRGHGHDGQSKGWYGIQLDGYEYGHDGNYHHVADNRVHPIVTDEEVQEAIHSILKGGPDA